MGGSALSFGDSIPGADLFSGKGIKTGTASQLGGAFTSAAGAVQDIFSIDADKATASSDRAAAISYRKAAGLATDNLDLTEKSYGIKQVAASREIFQTVSGEEAAVAGNGFKASGSFADILADSARQGDLQHSLISQQGEIDMNGLKSQIGSLNAQADQEDAAANAADSAGTTAGITGAIKGVAAAAQLAMFFA